MLTLVLVSDQYHHRSIETLLLSCKYRKYFLGNEKIHLRHALWKMSELFFCVLFLLFYFIYSPYVYYDNMFAYVY